MKQDFNDEELFQFLVAWVGGNLLAALLAVYLLTTHGIL